MKKKMNGDVADGAFMERDCESEDNKSMESNKVNNLLNLFLGWTSEQSGR